MIASLSSAEALVAYDCRGAAKPLHDATPNMAVNLGGGGGGRIIIKRKIPSQNRWGNIFYNTATSSQRDYLLAPRNKKVLCPVCEKTSVIYSIQGLHLRLVTIKQCM